MWPLGNCDSDFLHYFWKCCRPNVESAQWWMFKMLSTRLWRKQTNQISQYFWPNVSEGLTNSEHHFRVQLTFTPKHMYVIACYYYLIFNGFIIITSSRKHQIVCHTYLSMNCLCEREALSNTSMLQGPSSCNLKSEFNDLNKQTWRGEQNITTSQSGLCTKQCVQITTGMKSMQHIT